MATWMRPILCIAPPLAVAGIWWHFGYEEVFKHHVLATPLAGLAIGLPPLIRRTLVASDQLKASPQIAETANKNRADSTFRERREHARRRPSGDQMGWNQHPDKTVHEQPEYMESVVLSFCAFLRPSSDAQSNATPMKSNEQTVRIFEAINRWFKCND